jgi:DNA-binding HxlR family transcriptional regulator
MQASRRAIRCPVAATLDVVGDRWTLLIVRDLLRGNSRFSELARSVEGVTTTMLSDRLKRLESGASSSGRSTASTRRARSMC